MFDLFEYNEIIKDLQKHTSMSSELNNINLEKYNLIQQPNSELFSYTKFKNKILYGDILNYEDECIVNPANELLLGGGGIDGVIHNLSGELMLNEIKKIPLNSSGVRLMEGEAVITNGYNPLYPKIIHTVTPYYDENNNIKPNVMKNCFDSIFSLVKSKNIKSVTITPIGTGFYGFYYFDFTLICF